AEDGMPIGDAPRTRLVELMQNDEFPAVRLAAAQALHRLDHSAAASPMLEVNRAGDQDMILITDPALAQWRHAPAVELWLARAADASAPEPLRRSAIHALGEVAPPSAVSPLTDLATDGQTLVTLRLDAADAL